MLGTPHLDDRRTPQGNSVPELAAAPSVYRDQPLAWAEEVAELWDIVETSILRCERRRAAAMNWHNSFWQTMRQKSSYKRPAPDEDSKGNISKVPTRHEFSMTLTIINFLLTTLTVVLLFDFRSPIQETPVSHQHCSCPESTTDARYKNPYINPDIKRVAGYCEFMPNIDKLSLTVHPQLHSSTK